MNDNRRDTKGAFDKAFDDAEDQRATGILVMGKPGVGKSTLVEALEADLGPRPTVTFHEVSLNTTDGDLAPIYDELEEFVETHARGAILLVLGAPDRAIESEANLIWSLREFLGDVPIGLVCSKVDLIRPLRAWNPDAYGHEEPASEKEENIRRWVAYISSKLQIPDEQTVLFSVESPPASAVGVERVERLVATLIAGAAPLTKPYGDDGESADDVSQMTAHSGKAMKAYFIIAAACAATTVGSLATSRLINVGSTFASQTAMLFALGRLYGVSATDSRAIARAVIGTLADTGVGELVKRLLPEKSGLVSASSSAVFTSIIGKSYLTVLQKSDGVPEPGEVSRELDHRLKR